MADFVLDMDDIREHLDYRGPKLSVTPARVGSYLAGKVAKGIGKTFGFDVETPTLSEATIDVAGRIYEVLPKEGLVGLSGKDRTVITYSEVAHEYNQALFNISESEVVGGFTFPNIDDFVPDSPLMLELAFPGLEINERKKASVFIENLLMHLDSPLIEIGPVIAHGSETRFFAYREYRRKT